MNEVERLLRKDRVTGVTEPPDLRYTEAAVRRRMGTLPGPPPGRAVRADWGIFGLALLLTSVLVWLLVGRLGLNPWWLAALPLSLLPMSPILLTKEHDRS
ncbi:MAG TPA: hypothetical protein VNT01_15495 [Symbiobacteriaceae bacterium]|nr:hypothetical protein [Symbiobacteriaceae bacterium]